MVFNAIEYSALLIHVGSRRSQKHIGLTRVGLEPTRIAPNEFTDLSIDKLN